MKKMKPVTFQSKWEEFGVYMILANINECRDMEKFEETDMLIWIWFLNVIVNEVRWENNGQRLSNRGSYLWSIDFTSHNMRNKVLAYILKSERIIDLRVVDKIYSFHT